MTPAEANDGELFVQSRGGVFPEQQRTPRLGCSSHLWGCGVNGGKLKDWCFFI